MNPGLEAVSIPRVTATINGQDIPILGALAQSQFAGSTRSISDRYRRVWRAAW